MVVCPACGAHCAEGSRFCSACGAALAARQGTPERRLVTAVFCDLVGSTPLTESADPEDIDALLRTFGEMVAEVAATYGGVVEKYIGDAAVAVFGVPVAHEDDAERAVRAGLRIMERIPELPVVGGTPVRARIGVDTGRAVVRRDVDPSSGQGFMVGDAINTAARLQGIAPPMGVVVGGATHALTSSLFAFERVAGVRLKGKAAPVDVWLVRHPLTRTGVEARTLSNELVGREHELAALTRHLDEIAVGGPPRMVLVLGEAGIGKSRLVYEVARHAEASPTLFRWRTAECPPFGQTTPYAALSQIVRASAAILESDDAGEAARKLDAWLGERGDGAWLAARLRPLLGLDAPAASPEENFAAWERVLEMMASHGPLVLAFDDLHWADDGLLQWLVGLMDRVADVPLLVLCVGRPELLERAPHLATGDRCSRLVIHSLEGNDLDFLATSALEHAGLPAERSGEVRERCGGNPLFVEEFVRYLAEARSGDGTEPLDACIPETLEALIAARLDVLGDDPRVLLGDGAVVGQEFWRGVVAAMETSLTDDIDGALQVLIDRELAHPLPVSSVSGEVEYTFHHALVRDVAYSRLPRAVRATKHAQVAEWLEAALGDRPDEMTGVLAHHWVTALELSRAAHEDELAAAALAPAVRSLVRAGDHALALDVSIAESQYGQALGLAGPVDRQRPDLLVRWARALLEAGRISESIEAFEEGVDGLRGQDDAVATALALSDHSSALQLLGDMAGSQALLEEALSLLAGDRSVARVQVLARWSLHCTIMADDDEAIRAADEALELAAELRSAAPVRALISRGAYRCARCDERGFDDYAVALAEAVEQGLGREVGMIHFDWAEDEGNFYGPRAALARYREGLRLAESRKDRAMSFSLRYGIVRDLYRAGEWDDALAQARDLAPLLQTADNLAELGYLTAVQASMLVGRGDSVAAQSLFPVLELTADGRGEPLLRAECLVSASAVLHAMGDAAGARARLAECAELPDLAEEYMFDWSLPRALRLAAKLGDTGLTDALARLCRPGRPLYERVRPGVEAQLHERRADHETAAQQYAQAAAGWAKMDVPYEAALARVGRGRCLLEAGLAAQAVEPLEQALEVFDRLGARPAAEETSALIRRCGAPD